MEIVPLLEQLDEKNVETLNEPTRLRNSLVLIVFFLVYSEHDGRMLFRNFSTHSQHRALSPQEENFPPWELEIINHNI